MIIFTSCKCRGDGDGGGGGASSLETRIKCKCIPERGKYFLVSVRASSLFTNLCLLRENRVLVVRERTEKVSKGATCCCLVNSRDARFCCFVPRSSSGRDRFSSRGRARNLFPNVILGKQSSRAIRNSSRARKRLCKILLFSNSVK